jgi:hypothetical protein
MSGRSPLGQSKESQSYEGINIAIPSGGWGFTKAKRDPTSSDKKSPSGVPYAIGTIWLNTVAQNIWMMTQGGGVWTELAAGGASVNSIIGTANQIAASSATGNVTLSVPATFTSPGSVTATSGPITATNGNIVLGTAGNKLVSTSVGTTTTAGANSIGSVTLSGGTATVATTAVTANSLIFLSRQSIGATGAAALGQLSVGTITAGTSFVINAALTATATSLATTDVSVVSYMIVN